MLGERKIKSFFNFTHELWRQQPGLVVVQADVRLDYTHKVFEPANISRPEDGTNVSGLFEHSLVYRVFSASRQRLYREALFSAYRDKDEVDIDEIPPNKRVLAMLLAGETRTRMVDLVLIKSEVYLAHQDMQPFNDDDYQQLHWKAEELNVTHPRLRD
jgi:hypothetical protein